MTPDWDELARRMAYITHEPVDRNMRAIAQTVAALCRAQDVAETPPEIDITDPGTLRFRVRRVDMDGFLGRERHPRKWMEGMVVRPISMILLDEESVSIASSEVAKISEDHTQQVWTCLVPGGGDPDLVIEFMQHELELVR